MSTLAWIIGLTVLGGAMSALVASLFLALGLHSRAKLLPHLVSFATGALLGAALLALLPHAIEGVGIAGNCSRCSLIFSHCSFMGWFVSGTPFGEISISISDSIVNSVIGVITEKIPTLFPK
jgi:hypothetical protein